MTRNLWMARMMSGWSWMMTKVKSPGKTSGDKPKSPDTADTAKEVFASSDPRRDDKENSMRAARKVPRNNAPPAAPLLPNMVEDESSDTICPGVLCEAEVGNGATDSLGDDQSEDPDLLLPIREN